MELRELPKSAYKGKTFVLKYQTDAYYQIEPCEAGFTFALKKFEEEREMSFTDSFLGDWLDDPVAFGAFEGETLLGYVEGTFETWNKRYRVSNICIFEAAQRRQGLGTLLMQKILTCAKESGARMAVLETQSCNVRAIAFYKKQGFEVIGFDRFAYTNSDPERQEIRVEMGLRL